MVDRLLKAPKEKNGVDCQYAFLSIVDATNKRSWVLLCGGKEVALAKVAFGADASMNDMTGCGLKDEGKLTLAELKKKKGGGELMPAPLVPLEAQKFHDLLGASSHHRPEWTMIDTGMRGASK
eukprot:SAG31_NODE_7478_length_1679_cov_1.904430_1_plen_123_part_00